MNRDDLSGEMPPRPSPVSPVADPPPPSAALIASVANMSPVRARVPARSLFIVALFACAYSAWRATAFPLRADLGTLSVPWIVGIGAIWLAGFIVPLTLAILPGPGQVVPDGERAIRIAFLTATVLIGVGLLSGVGPFGDSRSVARGPAGSLSSWRGCVAAGLKVSVPTIVAGALALRRIAITDSWRLGAAVGAAGGSLAGLTLHLACSSGSSAHIALAHGGGVVIGAILGGLLLSLIDRARP